MGFLFGARGPAGVPGAAGTPGTAGQTVGNALLAGGGVVHTGALVLVVAAAEYIINGVSYASPQTTLTLATADPTNPRIDVVAFTTSNTAVIVQGTAAANPFEPVLDPGSQLRDTAVTVDAGATVLTTANTIIFTEGGVESWTETASGAPVNVASGTSPITGSVSVRVTAGVAGNYAQFANGSDFDTTTRAALAVTVKNDVAWHNSKSLIWQWFDGTVARGSAVTLRNGLYGFNGSNIIDEQQVVIPLQAFGVAGLPVDTLRATIAGGGSAMTFVLDDIYMQAGIAQNTVTSGMNWRGLYSAAAQYQLYDVVYDLAGATWIALKAQLAVTPVVGVTGWQQLGGGGSGGGGGPEGAILRAQMFR